MTVVVNRLLGPPLLLFAFHVLHQFDQGKKTNCVFSFFSFFIFLHAIGTGSSALSTTAHGLPIQWHAHPRSTTHTNRAAHTHTRHIPYMSFPRFCTFVVLAMRSTSTNPYLFVGLFVDFSVFSCAYACRVLTSIGLRSENNGIAGRATRRMNAERKQIGLNWYGLIGEAYG